MKRDLAEWKGENESEGYGEWRRVEESAVKRDQ